MVTEVLFAEAFLTERNNFFAFFFSWKVHNSKCARKIQIWLEFGANYDDLSAILDGELSAKAVYLSRAAAKKFFTVPFLVKSHVSNAAMVLLAEEK